MKKPEIFREKAGLNGREILGWAMYDWANSAFSTIVVTTLLGPYLTRLAESSGGIDLAGFHVMSAAFYPACVSISVALQVFVLPILGSFADRTGLKKELLILSAFTGSVSTMLLYLIEPGLMGMDINLVVITGGLLFVMANLAFGASVVLCNAFLPDIAPPAQRDRISSLGWAIGYLGGGIALMAALALFSFMPDKAKAVRMSLALAGAWWLVFTLIFPARLLRPGKPVKICGQACSRPFRGVRQVIRTLTAIRLNHPETLRFLVAYLVYNDGIQTVIAVATLFASKELGVSNRTLLLLILMIQFAAFFGSILFGWIAGKMGAKRSIMLSLVVWSGISVYAYGFLYSTFQLFILGAATAVVLGGSQALSRSLYSQLIPRQNESEYFAFYEISERGTSWIGPFIFAGAVQFTGSTRVAILSLMVFFVVGLLLLGRVDVERGMMDAGNDTMDVVI